MDISVLLEPTPTGFRASTGAPLNLTAEAATAEAALAELRSQITMKQMSGTQVVPLTIPEPDRLWELTTRLAANQPFLDQWDTATKEYRRQREAEEAAELIRTSEQANRNGTSTPTRAEPAA